MIPRVFQPVVVVLIVGVLALLRMIPALDPVERLIGGNSQLETDSFENAQIAQLEAQNQQLRAELGFNMVKADMIRADVLSKTVASFREAVRISAGSRQGVLPDQPVLHRGFLIGRIGWSEDSLATALLLGDPDVRIPVVIGQAQGIVVPQAGGLIIDQVVGEVKAGDNVLSSGIEGIYPPGLLVGTVGDELERDIFGRYVLNTPLDTQRLDFVSVIVSKL